MAAAAESGCLLVADISGYTGYVTASPLEYAEDVVSDVTRTVVERLERVIRVNKLEGDAAFGYALDGDVDASMLLDLVEESYFAFRRRLRGIEHAVSCGCAACTGVAKLDLKFVVHHGSFVRRSDGRGEELTGRDVIVVHRLLKNRVAEALGVRAYALYTEACAAALGLDPASLELARHVERYPGVGEVVSYVSDLEGRWNLEERRRRIQVGDEDASFSVEIAVPGSPELVWELLTSPQRRLLWQVDAIDQADVGGRRSTGTSSVCVDGRTKIYEEIVDWRPFDYFTERFSLPGGVRAILTTALVAEGDRTRAVTRVRREAGTRLGWGRASRRLRRRLESQYGRLGRLVATQIPEERRLPIVPG